MNENDYLRMIEEQRRAEELKQLALFKFMTKEARERFKRVEIAHPDLAQKALSVILQGVQTGRVRIIDDSTFKNILMELSSTKKEFRIRRV